jgi:hypothetical protein
MSNVKNAIKNKNDVWTTIIENLNLDKDILDFFVEFITFTKKELEIELDTFLVYLIKIDEREKFGIPTSATYNPENNVIVVLAENRMFLDIARSIAHEMVHLRQNERGDLAELDKIPDIGGKIEDEANAMAGVIMKKFIYSKKGNELLTRLC